MIARVIGFRSGPVSWNGLAAVVLGALLAKWVWLLAAPPVAAVAAMGDRSASADADKLFGVAASSSANARALVALPNVRLAGVYAGSRSFAILELDGKKQVGVPLGGEVVRGVTLQEVAADHVVIESNGTRQRIDLNVAGGPATVAPAATPPSRAPGRPAVSVPSATNIAPPAAPLGVDSLPPGQREAIRRQLEGGGAH